MERPKSIIYLLSMRYNNPIKSNSILMYLEKPRWIEYNLTGKMNNDPDKFCIRRSKEKPVEIRYDPVTVKGSERQSVTEEILGKAPFAVNLSQENCLSLNRSFIRCI